MGSKNPRKKSLDFGGQEISYKGNLPPSSKVSFAEILLAPRLEGNLLGQLLKPFNKILSLLSPLITFQRIKQGFGLPLIKSEHNLPRLSRRNSPCISDFIFSELRTVEVSGLRPETPQFEFAQEIKVEMSSVEISSVEEISYLDF